MKIALSTYIVRMQQIDQYTALLGKNNTIGYSLGSQKYQDYNKVPLKWIWDVKKQVKKARSEMDKKLYLKIYLLYIIGKKLN